MENQEAISVINQVRDIINNTNSWDNSAIKTINEAFDLAVESLSNSEK